MAFVNPVEHVVLLPAKRLAPQRINPNKHTRRNFQELCDSIRKYGYTSALLVVEQPTFDPFTEPLNLLRNHNGLWSMQSVEDCEDPDEALTHFQFQVVDGTHRLMAMLANEDLFDRHEGMIPAMVLHHMNEDDLMSLEVMQNVIHGEHDLGDMERMVHHLSQMDKDADWMQDHLHVDREVVNRLLAHGGMADAAVSEPSAASWIPENDPLFDELKLLYITKECRAWLKQHGVDAKGWSPEYARKEAVKLGYDMELAQRMSALENDRYPNGRKITNGTRYRI